MLQSKVQTFNDGIVKIYLKSNIATPGNIPKDGLTLKEGPLRYKERTVGVERFWDAKQAKAEISLLLRVQRIRTVSTQDIAVPNDGEQYEIVQVQYPEDVIPPVMDLSLVRLEAKYEIAGY